MKCRRSNASRGSRLRSRSPTATRNPAPVTRKQTLRVPPAEAVDDAGANAELRIDGRHHGQIHHPGTVSVGPNGAVVGDISATSITIEGEITGNLSAAKLIRVAASGKIVGDLCAPRIAVARGALLRGCITMRHDHTPPADLDDFAVDTLLSGNQRA